MYFLIKDMKYKLISIFKHKKIIILIRFKKTKPVIFISARVHPGETPASHSMKGILNFLCNK